MAGRNIGQPEWSANQSPLSLLLSIPGSRIHRLNSLNVILSRYGTGRVATGKARRHGLTALSATGGRKHRRAGGARAQSEGEALGHQDMDMYWATGRSAAGPRGARALSVTHVSGQHAARPRPTTASDSPWLPMTWWARLAFWLRCASRRVAHCSGRSSRAEQSRTGVVVVVGQGTYG